MQTLNILLSHFELTTAQMLHTSGSTSMPKLVTVPHSAIGAIDAQRLISARSEDKAKCQLEVMAEAAKIYQSFPLFHVAGFELLCFFIFSGCIVILGPPYRPPSTGILRDVVRVASPDGALLPPQILNQLSEDEVLLTEVLRSIKWLCAGGGM